MRWAVPVCDVSEVEPLCDAGAGEFYCGILEETWRASYGGHDTISRRAGCANLPSLAAARDVVNAAHRAGISVFLALNARYIPEQYVTLCALLRDWDALGGDGVHISDMGLLVRAAEMSLRTRLSVSLLAVTVNAAAVAWYRTLGVTRVVLPRFLTPDEMRAVLDGCEGEAMVMGDKCPFIDGLCRFYHGVGFADADRKCATACLAQTVAHFDTTFRSLACRELLGEPQTSPPCAVCALEALSQAGITIGKLGGRGMPLELRLRELRFVRDASAYPASSRPALYNARFGACHCYYGGSLQ